MSSYVTADDSVEYSAVILGEGRFVDVTISSDACRRVTNKLELNSDIHSMFAQGEWIVTIPSIQGTMLSSHILSIGTKIEFIIAVPSQTLPVVITMAILAIGNAGGHGLTEGNRYSLKLISPWYFSQKVLSVAYQGSVSSIINQIVTNEFTDDFAIYDTNAYSSASSTSGVVYNTEIEDSIDNPNAIRYRTFQSASKFLKDNLLVKARGNLDTAMFIYTDLYGKLRFFSFASAHQKDRFLVIHQTSSLKDNFSEIFNDPLKAKRVFVPTGNSYDFNQSEKHALWSLTKPALIHLLRPDSSTKNGADGIILTPLTNNFKNPYVFVTSNRTSDPFDKRFVDDSLRSYDTIYSSVIQHYTRDLMNEQSVQITGHPNFNLIAGYMADVILENSTDKTQSALTQSFLISRCSFIFRGFATVSTITLQTPSYNASDLSTVPELLSRPS